MKIVIYIGLIIMLLPVCLLGQNYNYTQYNVENGLAQSQVTAIFQDRFGNLWVGTNGGGVSKYDGKEFKNKTKDDGLVDNVVYSICEDDNGNLFFGTNNGLSIYNGFSFKNFTEDNGLPINRVWKVVKDKKGKIWIGTGKGVVTYENGKFVPFDVDTNLNKAIIISIYFDSSNNIWFGSLGSGLFNFDGKRIIRFSTENGLKNNSISSIIEKNKNELYVCTYDGVEVIKNNTIHHTKTSKAFTSVVKTIHGEYLFSVIGGYISNENYLFGAGDFPPFNKKIMSDIKIWTMIVDKEDNLWVGSYDGNGLVKIPQRTFFNFNSKQLNNRNVYNITEYGQDTFLIALFSPSVDIIKLKNISRSEKVKNENEYDANYQKWEIPDSRLCGIPINSTMKDKNNNIWISTGGGISVCKFNLKDTISYSVTTPNNYDKVVNATLIKRVGKVFADSALSHQTVYSTLEDKNGKIWLATKSGITLYQDGKFSNFNKNFPELKEVEVYRVYEDRDGYIWFTSEKGVFVYDGKKLLRLGKDQGFTSEKAICVVQDVRGNYWFGTKQGIFRYDNNFFTTIKKASSDLIDKEKGLSSNNVYLLIFDNDGNLFVGTDKGIDKLDTKLYNTKRIVKVRNYGKLEGFMGQECNMNACCKDHLGRLWFGTIDGVTVYDPSRDNINEVKPITQVTGIQLAYKSFDWSEYSDGLDTLTGMPINLVLPYDKNHLSFEFVAASLTIPEKVMYQYKLVGLSDEWSPPKIKNEADYPSLPNGEYTFMVKACNNDGIWNDEPTTFSFIIKPPFWKTWWFYTILAIFFLAIIITYIRWREAKLKRDKAILEKIVEERTEEVVKQKEIVEQKNKDITDSINYAKNIQEAILVNITEIQKTFAESFILYRPRDIVSGDFYWFTLRGKIAYIAATDCTGHGVPGAFMSMLGLAFLNEIVNKNEEIKANEILNRLRENVIVSLHQTGKAGQSKDGMDMALCRIDLTNKNVQFSGANNPLYYIPVNYKEMENSKESDKTPGLIEIKPNKMPIGYGLVLDPFENHEFQSDENDLLYLFSDGYADQFGGPKGKKFKYTQLKELLLNIKNQPMNDQRRVLERTMIDWRGEHEQIDDILVIGVKMNIILENQES